MARDTGVLAALPDDLRYLIEPALKHGRYQADDDIFDFLDRATDEEMEELATIAERVLLSGDFRRVMNLLDVHPITETEEAARLCFLLGVMDYADMKFDSVEE